MVNSLNVQFIEIIWAIKLYMYTTCARLCLTFGEKQILTIYIKQLWDLSKQTMLRINVVCKKRLTWIVYLREITLFQKKLSCPVI